MNEQKNWRQPLRQVLCRFFKEENVTRFLARLWEEGYKIVETDSDDYYPDFYDQPRSEPPC